MAWGNYPFVLLEKKKNWGFASTNVKRVTHLQDCRANSNALPVTVNLVGFVIKGGGIGRKEKITTERANWPPLAKRDKTFKRDFVIHLVKKITLERALSVVEAVPKSMKIKDWPVFILEKFTAKIACLEKVNFLSFRESKNLKT